MLVPQFIRYKIKIHISYYYASLAPQNIHPNVLQQKEELISKVKAIYPSSIVSVEFLGADRLMNLYNTDNDYTDVLEFSDQPISLAANEYVALVNLATYFNFITDDNRGLRNSIFEANVRDYQGNNSVNSSIAKTLEEPSKEDFWWLNNGVTIIASELIPMTNRSLKIKNPEIVNGLQTSREIFNFYSSSLELLKSEKRNILIRILKPEDETSRDKVIFATNNQTSIPKYSLRVTDTIHLQIELYFKSRGLYYDRRKNYYKNQKKKTSDIIGVSFLAQCLITLILKKPDFARARPSTLLTDDETYKELYENPHDLESYYNVARIGKYIKSIVMTSELPQPEKNDILFYVIYAVVAKRLNSKNITFENLKTFDYKSLTEEEVNNSEQLVFEAYNEAGRNSRVAKSSDFINKVISKMDLED